MDSVTLLCMPTDPRNLADAADAACAQSARLSALAERDIAKATRTLAYARRLAARARALSDIERLDASVRQGACDRAQQSAAEAADVAAGAASRAACAALEGEAVWAVAIEALATYPYPIRLYAGLLWRAVWARVRR